ncbi:uncharacterized protein LOC132272869 [Cornus florida]|uniref:uncharacterized protein LOC132272869 n=1 Tax=Cornus florida TaxID=4283 RepID=UPI0028980C3D|nr:uncharacterized protein LOC132272869 [Cornus florida]
MDREQEEMQFLGPFGIYTEAYQIILSWRKILTQITLALILPLSFILLAHIKVSELLTSRITHNQTELQQAQAGTQTYDNISNNISSEWTAFWLFELAYTFFFLIFSLTSTSAVVYTVACIYTSREVTFEVVMSVVPKVWKRLMITFLSTFLSFFAYTLVSAIIAILIIRGMTIGSSGIRLLIVLILFIIYGLGLLYMTIVWQLASAVSVLEDSYGFKAMVKSKNLIKGKMWVAIVIFFVSSFSSFVIYTLFEKFVVHGESLILVYKVGFGMLCLSFQSMLFLFGLIIQTIIYFVCKSYHHENIDKSDLSDHLEVYLGEYVPLKETDVQLGQFHV